MIDVINMLMFVLIFMLVYFSIIKYQIILKTDKYKKKNNLYFSTKDHSIKNFFQKINFIKSKDNFLSKQGYPLNLNAISYYILKFSLTILLFFAGSINYDSILLGTILGILGYFCVDLYIYLNKKNRDNEICVDLLNVVDSISLQLSAEMNLKDSLRRQFENCKNKDFKKAILEFATQYELSELDINKSLAELKNKFDILEINMFCNSLKEYSKVGNILEILENLSDTLKTKYIEKIKNDTRTKVLYITFGVILALGNIVLLTFYPLFISIGQGFNSIFN